MIIRNRSLRSNIIGVFALMLGTGWLCPVYGGDITETYKVIASDGAFGDEFGWSVALEGETLLVGATGVGRLTGAVYAFKRDATGQWIQQAKLMASDGGEFQYFGQSVALSGGTALIGAYNDDDNGSGSGSVYAFVRDEVGQWTQQAKLLPSDGVVDAFFGNAISVSGSTWLVGAYQDDDKGPASGSAYVFVQDELGNWIQQAKLLANDGAEIDYFGLSVGISGNTAVVGAPYNNANGEDTGSVYVFERDNTGHWLQKTKLLNCRGSGRTGFGSLVTISGDTVGVLDSSGLACVFVRDEVGNWSFQSTLAASGDFLSNGILIDGDTALLGRAIEQEGGYIYRRDQKGRWSEQPNRLVSADGALIGSPIGFSGNTAVFGNYHADGIDSGTGAAYIFENITTNGYEFSGFFPSIKKPPALNKIKAGSPIPFKFSLNGDQGLDILSPGWPASRRIKCATGKPLGSWQLAFPPDGKGLSYDSGMDQYLYIWKTLPKWRGSCREFNLRLDDNSDHKARFRFR